MHGGGKSVAITPETKRSHLRCDDTQLSTSWLLPLAAHTRAHRPFCARGVHHPSRSRRARRRAFQDQVLGEEKMVLVGASLGGAAAIDFAFHHPERVERVSATAVPRPIIANEQALFNRQESRAEQSRVQRNLFGNAQPSNTRTSISACLAPRTRSSCWWTPRASSMALVPWHRCPTGPRARASRSSGPGPCAPWPTTCHTTTPRSPHRTPSVGARRAMPAPPQLPLSLRISRALLPPQPSGACTPMRTAGPTPICRGCGVGVTR